MKASLTVVAVALAACGQEPTAVREACRTARETDVAGDASLLTLWPSERLPLKVFLHESFKDRCQDSLAKALAFWQGHVQVTNKVSTASVEIFFTNYLDTCGTEKEYILGCTRFFNETAFPYETGFASVQVTNCAWQVVAHELGHALGFSHSENTGNIMYPYTSTSVTSEPLITVRELSLLYYDCE